LNIIWHHYELLPVPVINWKSIRLSCLF
jgi:hypothetical protein